MRWGAWACGEPVRRLGARVSRLLFWAGCLGLLGAPLVVEATDWPYEVPIEEGVPVKITCDASFAGMAKRGFLPVKISIRNGTANELAWRAFLENRDGYAYDISHSTGYTMNDGRILSSEDRSEPLVVPAGATREFQVRLAVSSGPGGLKVRGPHVRGEFVAWVESRPFLADNRLPLRFVEEWRERCRSLSRPSDEDLGIWADSPDDWRSYSGYQLLLLLPSRWTELSEAQRNALCRYVAMGGSLAFVVEGDSPLPVPAEFGVAASIGVGMPAVVCGLGMIRGVPAEPSACCTEVLRVVKTSRETDAGFWPDPLPDWLAAKLPRAALIALLLVSALLAGPGALFWLAKRQQRQRLFLVLPAVAVGTTLVLLALIYLHDGTGGEGRRAVLAALVDGRSEMVVYQQQAARCGFLFETAFTVPEQAIVEMTVPRSSNGGFAIERTGGECRGDWFRNRSATGQTLVHTVPTRAALELRPAADGGPPTVVSTFPAPLKELLVVWQGKVWTADRVPPGTPTPLVQNDRDLMRVRYAIQFRLAPAFLHAPNYLFEDTDLADRFFAATDRLEGAPIPTLDSIRWTDTILVTGRCREGRRP